MILRVKLVKLGTHHRLPVWIAYWDSPFDAGKAPALMSAPTYGRLLERLAALRKFGGESKWTFRDHRPVWPPARDAYMVIHREFHETYAQVRAVAGLYALEYPKVADMLAASPRRAEWWRRLINKGAK